MSRITLVMYSSTIILHCTRVRILKKYEYSSMSTITLNMREYKHDYFALYSSTITQKVLVLE